MAKGIFAAAAIAAASVTCTMIEVQAATISIDRDAFTAGNSVRFSEQFDRTIARDESITFDSGIAATASAPDVPITQNEVSRGSYVGFVRRDGARDISFDFGSPVLGFGADFTSAISNTSLMVTGLFDNAVETVSIADAIGSQGFFGLTSETPFQTISFRTNAGAFLFGSATPFGGETFQLDNLIALGRNDVDMGVAPVPLPAAGLLLIAGLGAFGILRRRKS